MTHYQRVSGRALDNKIFALRHASHAILVETPEGILQIGVDSAGQTYVAHEGRLGILPGASNRFTVFSYDKLEQERKESEK